MERIRTTPCSGSKAVFKEGEFLLTSVGQVSRRLVAEIYIL